ncbi:MAG: hypothetical protein SFX72_19665 [Isosphaeraceae bacterium]|nr:hypothetical protein [Isosphaeraceae bacterium]
MAAQPYFAPTYFSSFYFGGFRATPPLSIGYGEDAAFCDQDAFEEMKRLFEATTAFGSVIFAANGERGEVYSGSPPLLVIAPTRWLETKELDPEQIVRQVEFELVLIVKSVETRDRLVETSRLEAIITHTLENAKLGDPCIPAMTHLTSARHDWRCKAPEHRLTLEGRFAFFIPR